MTMGPNYFNDYGTYWNPIIFINNTVQVQHFFHHLLSSEFNIRVFMKKKTSRLVHQISIF